MQKLGWKKRRGETRKSVENAPGVTAEGHLFAPADVEPRRERASDREMAASMAGPAGDALHHDLASRVLLELPVVDRLQMLQLSQTWKAAGEDSASWATCDLITRPNRWSNVCWSAKIIRRSIERAGARLSTLRVSSQDDISEALAGLRTCHMLIELEVGWHMFSKELLPSDIPQLQALLAWLPPPPFKLKTLWTSGMRESLPDLCLQVSMRTEWFDMARCEHCRSEWGLKHRVHEDVMMIDYMSRSTDFVFGPCAGINCTKKWLCGHCFNNCRQCDEVTCPDCTGSGAFECTTCWCEFCSKCAAVPTDGHQTFRVACAVDDAHSGTCAHCVERLT